MPWRPNVTVAAIIEEDRRYLFVEESIEGQQVYNQPAGHLENHESLIEAVVREVAEETCRAFTPQGLVGVYLYEQKEPKPSYLRFCFFGDAGPEQPQWQRDPDIDTTVWMTHAQLMEREAAVRSPMVLETIRDYENGQRYPLEMLRSFLI